MATGNCTKKETVCLNSNYALYSYNEFTKETHLIRQCFAFPYEQWGITWSGFYNVLFSSYYQLLQTSYIKAAIFLRKMSKCGLHFSQSDS